MVSTSDASESPSERRGKHRKFRGTTTVLTSILGIGSSRGRNEKITLATYPSVTCRVAVNNSNSRRSGVGNRKSSKSHHRHHLYPSSSSTCNTYHPRIPPFPGTYLTTMDTSIPMPSASSTHISLGHRPSPTALPINSMPIPPEQTYYMPSHGYSQHVPLSNQPPMNYNIGPSPLQSQTNLQSYMYMKAYLRDPWLNDGFRLMVLLPVGHRNDGSYGILNAGVKQEQVHSLCFYYADSILYYNIPDDGYMYFIPS